MNIEGKLHTKFDTQNVSATFRKRDFVLEESSNPMYPQLVMFQLTQDKVDLLDKFNIGDKIGVTFNLRGREWTNPEGEKKYFNTLEAWRIAKSEAAPQPQGVTPTRDAWDDLTEEDPDLPF